MVYATFWSSDFHLTLLSLFAVLQEACSLDASRLTTWQRIRRFFTIQYLFKSPCAVNLLKLTAGTLGGSSRHVSSAAAAQDYLPGQIGSSSDQAVADPAVALERQAAIRKIMLEGCGPLSNELLQAVAVHGKVMVAVADWAMFDVFGVNWLTHVQRSGISNYLIAAMDQVRPRAPLRSPFTMS